MIKVYNTEQLSHSLLSKKTCRLSDKLLAELVSLGNLNNFYIYPINDDINVTFSVKNNVIISKSFYQKINGKIHIHRDNYPACLHFSDDGLLDIERWYNTSVNGSDSSLKPFEVEHFYIDKNKKIQSSMFNYETSKNKYRFKEIVFSHITKKIERIVFLNGLDTILTNEFHKLKYTESLSNKLKTLNFEDLFDLKKIKEDLDLLELIAY